MMNKFIKISANIALVAVLAVGLTSCGCSKKRHSAKNYVKQNIAPITAKISSKIDRLKMALELTGLEDAVVIDCSEQNATVVANKIRNANNYEVETLFTVGMILGIMDKLEFKGDLYYINTFNGKKVSGTLIPIKKAAAFKNGKIKTYEQLKDSVLADSGMSLTFTEGLSQRLDEIKKSCSVK